MKACFGQGSARTSQTLRAHAVKGVIYDRKGRLLLQQRDHFPGLPFPGCWTFFGGLVEPGENLRAALDREMREELGCPVGPVGEELFTWAWKGEDPALNHVFAVPLATDPARLVLREGQAMGWFLEEQIGSLPATPLLTENLENIRNFLRSQAPRFNQGETTG